MWRFSAWNACAGLSTLLASFASGLIVARLLGPAGMGQVVLTVWLTTVAVLLAGLGVPPVLIRFLPEINAAGDQDEAKALISVTFRTILLTTAIGSALLLAAAVVCALLDDRNLALIVGCVALLFAIQALATFARCQLMGAQLFRTVAILSGWSALLQVVTVFIGAWFGGIPGALLGYAAGYAPSAWRCLDFFGAARGLSPPMHARMISYARTIGITSEIDSLVWPRIELLIIAQLIGPDGVAIYAIGLTLANLATQLPVQMSGPLLPHLSMRLTSEGEAETARTYRSAVTLFSLVAMPACLGAAALSPDLVRFLYGPAFANAIPTASILIAGAAFHAVGTLALAMIQTMERGRFFVLLGLMSGVTMIVAALIVAPFLGTTGIACVRVAVHLVVLVLAIRFLARLGFHTAIRPLLLIAGASVITTGVAAIFAALLGGGLLGIMGGVAAGVAVYAALLPLLKPLDGNDAGSLSRLIEQAPGKMGRVARGYMECLVVR